MKVFHFKIQKCTFLGVTQFLSILAYETIESQMFLWSVVLKMHEHKFINIQKWLNLHLQWLITFFKVHFQK